MLIPYQEFVRLRTYARFTGIRRETWEETVNRYMNFFINRVPYNLHSAFLEAVKGIHNMHVMPSMRALWSAGPALERENLAGFNCTYLPIEGIHSFSETLYILMNGAGVGFSVEQKYVNKLPTIPSTFTQSTKPIVVQDSKEGWAEAVELMFIQLYDGRIPELDTSHIRPYGAPLKTFGGRASGPEPLKRLHASLIQKFRERRGQKLSTLDVHDIMCVIADVVVSGGVRRAACISLSDYNDDDMAHCKDNLEPRNYHRFFANNSLVYTTEPSEQQIRNDMCTILSSGTGERGIFNRHAAHRFIQNSRRDHNYDWGCNPCSEIILRPYQCCNLSEVVLRRDDDEGTILRKVEQATILGILQSTLDNYNIVNERWHLNAKEERLLGVSLTGLRDCLLLKAVSDSARSLLSRMKEKAIQTAMIWSQALGINMPSAITCCKPSGTVSQLVDSSSGLHPRYSQYYVRRVRIDVKDPLFIMLADNGVTWHPEVGQTREQCTTAVLEFPVMAPPDSVTTDDITALEQLEYYKMLQLCWCEHKPSCTIYVGDDEKERVIDWVVENIDIVSGISFFPRVGGIYKLPPYENITRDKYKQLMMQNHLFNYNKLSEYERTDLTSGAQETACAGGACEL